MPVTPSQVQPVHLPINQDPAENENPSQVPPPQLSHSAIRDAREIIARDRGNKTRLVRSYLEFRANAQGDGALTDALRELTNAIFDGDPISAGEFEKILKKIDESEEKDIPVFLQKIREDIYPAFSKKYSDALHACNPCAEPIRTRIRKSHEAVAEARSRLASEGASGSCQQRCRVTSCSALQ
jgi:hypothetical protein